MKPRIVVVGCGYWGMNYVRLMNQLSDAELAGVCDMSQDRLDIVAERFPETKLYKSVDKVLDENDFDGAIVCTTPETHHEVASAFIKAGKSVLVEKPLVTEISEGEDLIKLAKENNVTLMVGHIFLYNAGVELVKSYMNDGELGKVYYLYARRTNLGPIRNNVNAVWDLAPHDISIFNYLLDSEPEWVSANGTMFLDTCCEDVGFIVLRYPNGVIANIHVSWADPHKEREMVIVGSRARISFDDVKSQEPVRVFQKGVAASTTEAPDFGEYRLSIRDGNILSPKVPASEPLKNQVVHFLECMRTGEKPHSDGTNGLQIVRVLKAIDASMEQKGVPVKVG